MNFDFKYLTASKMVTNFNIILYHDNIHENDHKDATSFEDNDKRNKAIGK